MRKGTAAAAIAIGTLVGPAAGIAAADFVCPVLPVSDHAKDHSNAGFITIADGDTSILPGAAGVSGAIDVPAHATNSDGAGSPGGAHASPGESGYTAIWNE